MRQIDVTPIEIRDYAQSYGWVLVKDALKEGLFVLNSPNKDYKQLLFPIEPTSSNFNDLAELAISKISDQTNKSFDVIVEEIREVNDDVISLRYFSNTKIVNSLSFQEALNSIEATKQMILSAGCSVVNPAIYHKRLARAEATDLLRKTRFRHTQQVSFIIKISCPIQLEAPPKPDLFNDDYISKPISRKAFEIINLGALKLLNAVEEDSFTELLEEQKYDERPIISYNFCDSIVDLFDDERELPFEMNFQWSRSHLNKLPALQVPPTVRFPYSFKSKLNELKNYFRPESKETSDTFFGSVESLNGNEDNDGRRSGEVLLALLIEGEVVNARTILDANNYDIAYKSHGYGGGLIKVKGKLLGGKRTRNLEDVVAFESVSK
jgi:hypothetical protein